LTLADTSAWVEYLRATGSRVHLRHRGLVDAGELATTDVVLMELLAGARDDDHREQLRQLLARCRYFAVLGPDDYESAADLYRRCRLVGVTVRQMTDCLIAVVAIRNGMDLLQDDRDFAAIASHAPLRLA
jgi:predicted nucleic acid-binding protein